MPPEAAEELEGSWVGQEKQRYDFVLKLVEQRTTTRGYWVYRMTDRHGNLFIAFDGREEWREGDGGNNQLFGNGDCFTCRATVNRHDIAYYKYGSPDSKFKQTVLNRIKLGNILEKTEN